MHDDFIDIAIKYCVSIHRFDDEEELVLHDLTYDVARMAIYVADYMGCESFRLYREPYHSVV